jgi:hypothetical protein
MRISGRGQAYNPKVVPGAFAAPSPSARPCGPGRLELDQLPVLGDLVPPQQIDVAVRTSD